jgi:hypothetical protein
MKKRNTVFIAIYIALLVVAASMFAIKTSSNQTSVTSGVPDYVYGAKPYGEAPALDWIYPGKVEITNYKAGVRVGQEVVVHNGGDSLATMNLSFGLPNSQRGEFVIAPEDAKNWVQINAERVELQPGESKSVMVFLEVPEQAKSLPDNWEFHICMWDATQGGNVVTQMCCRWLVSMR